MSVMYRFKCGFEIPVCRAETAAAFARIHDRDCDCDAFAATGDSGAVQDAPAAPPAVVPPGPREADFDLIREALAHVKESIAEWKTDDRRPDIRTAVMTTYAEDALDALDRLAAALAVPVSPGEREPCPFCGCPGEKFDGHVCEDYEPGEREQGDDMRVIRELLSSLIWRGDAMDERAKAALEALDRLAVSPGQTREGRLATGFEDIGRFAASHSAIDSPEMLLAALHFIAAECERGAALAGGDIDGPEASP